MVFVTTRRVKIVKMATDNIPNLRSVAKLLTYVSQYVAIAAADNFRYSMKNFDLQGEYCQMHDCGTDHATMKTESCAVCRKENAKLANYPLQPIERCSASCLSAFDVIRRDGDKRPPGVSPCTPVRNTGAAIHTLTTL